MQRFSCNSFRPFFVIVCLSFASMPFGCLPDEPDPDLIVSFDDDRPSVLEQTIEEGGDTVYLEVELRNTGDCDLDFTTSFSTVDNWGWLMVSPDSGTVAVGVPEVIDVAIDVAGPPVVLAGTYTGTIVIDGECTTNGVPALGSPIVISVNLTVTPLVAAMEVDDERVGQDIVTLVDQWNPIATHHQPSPRAQSTAVWLGSRMIVWGGGNGDETFDTGGVYEPTTDTWTATSLVGAPSARRGHAVASTREQMWIMGGTPDASDYSTLLDDGGIYYPATNSWAPLPDHFGLLSARWGHTMVFGVGRVVVWGGYVSGEPPTNTGAICGGTGAWAATSTDGDVPEGRAQHTAVWTGTHMIVWGGQSGADFFNTGGLLEPAMNTWEAMTLEDAPSARAFHTAVWTGKEMIVWGGQHGGTTFHDGGRYDPFTDTWHPMDDSGPTLFNHRAVWTGDRMLVWGTDDPTTDDPQTGVGGFYDPVTDTWTSMTTVNDPLKRASFVGVWTGQEFVVWGGQIFDPPTFDPIFVTDGGAYH